VKSTGRSKALLAATAVLVLIAVTLSRQSIMTMLARPPPPEKITVALSNDYPGSGLLYIAAAKGFYADEGLDVTLQPYTSGLDAMNAAIEKRADLGTTGDVPLMFAAMDNRPVSVVATIFTAGGAHGVVARRDRGISSLADLKGKVIGVTRRTDGDFILSTMAAQHQTSLNELRIEPLPPEKMVEAIMAGKVDAVSTWEPWLSNVSKALGENAVAFRAEASFAVDFSLAGHADWVRANPEKVKRLLRGLLRAKKFADENPTAARSIIVKNANIDPALFETAGPRYRFVVQLNQRILILLEDMARWAIQNNLTDRTTVPNFLDVLSLDALTAVNPDAVTIVR